MKASRRRSLAKAITWRITGTADTFVITWIVTGKTSTAGLIAGTEVITKVSLYYFHERAWTKIKWGK
ncbi:MAG: DUF2061 domain-containing protein [Actinobacteria bacterium]|nr:DUF2061 domain-containing protein [Actinomycetota bacterium]MTA65739.1 DUF2061 domain-containing protein [Actinomycetota bacterium]